MKIMKYSFVKIFFCSLIFLSISFYSLVLCNTTSPPKTNGGNDKYLKQNGME